MLSGVENCRTANHALFAPQQTLQGPEVLVESLKRLRSSNAQVSSTVSISCDIFPGFSELPDEDCHERKVLSTQVFGISDLKSVVSDAWLCAFTGNSLPTDKLLSKWKPFMTFPWFADAPNDLH